MAGREPAKPRCGKVQGLWSLSWQRNGPVIAGGCDERELSVDKRTKCKRAELAHQEHRKLGNKIQTTPVVLDEAGGEIFDLHGSRHLVLFFNKALYGHQHLASCRFHVHLLFSPPQLDKLSA